MTIRLMDHVAIVVEDLDAAIAFFTELGMELEGRQTVEGEWVARVNRLDDARVEIAMLHTPDGHSKVELSTFHSPGVVATEPYPAPSNALGFHSVMFLVDDLDDVLARLEPHGGGLIGSVETFADAYRLCYVRGPGGIIVALSEEIT